MPCRLAEEGLFLDPRPADLAQSAPFAFSANIPAGELPNRLHELPAKDEVVRIAEAEPWSSQALEWLLRGGRKAETATPEPVQAAGFYRLWKPNPFLTEVLPNLSPGKALDLGCGAGRESVSLAGHGWSVVAADVLPDALERGKNLARKYLAGGGPPPIEWLQRDLEKDGPPEGPFDLIVSFRYLHRPLLHEIEMLLSPGGSLILETFTELHRKKHGKPSSDDHVLKLGELPTLAPNLQVRHADEGWRGEVHTGRLWAIKH